MADESTNGAGTQAGGQAAAIEALFTGAPAETQETDPGVIAAGGLSQGTGPAPDPHADDAWTEGYVPKSFRNEAGEFNGNQDAVFKSWMDGRQRISQLEKQIADAAKAAAPLPSADEYIAGMDWEALAQKAPNAYVGGEAENPVVVNLLRQAHAAGLTQDKAQEMVIGYLGSLNEHVEPQRDEATARAEALAHLGPNGPQIAEQVKARLQTLAQRQAIPEPQMAVLGQMMLNGPALALLDRLTAYGGSVAPPGASTITVVDQEKAQAEARRKLGTLDAADWAKNKARYIAEWNAANPG